VLPFTGSAHLVNATEVTAGLAESNGSLLLGLLRDSLHVTCGLTACIPGSAPGPTLGNEYGKTLPFMGRRSVGMGGCVRILLPVHISTTCTYNIRLLIIPDASGKMSTKLLAETNARVDPTYITFTDY